MSQYARFIKAKNLDKRMVLDYLQGQDPRKVYPLYMLALWTSLTQAAGEDQGGAQ